ncbi:Fe-Mn family superoxide dismutase [Metabacillus iocasae]|uniref:superoxide dismutase n=1 Tax=Priestia iocasae TaxID=2291674 RepID=A0ABS2QU26_9BACI|nr:Fe-Mn family superoxide dismutase [Metabacillus iocasae]
MTIQYQHAFRKYVSDTEEWCLSVLTDSEGYSVDWLENVRFVLELAQGYEENEEILEEDILTIQTCMERLEHSFCPEVERQKQSARVPIGQHKLPPLPYRYNALEPYIATKIMELHHQKHHKSYVDGLNKAEKKMQEARETENFDLIKHWEREAAFHGSGHYLHTMFWENMSPNGGGQPRGRLAQQIVQDFGSFDKFKKHFSAAADKVEGVGWALLVWSPRAHRLEILQTEKQQLFTQWDTIPLLGLDVWEHAYYLQYQNDRKTYINNWWNIVNWRDVEDRYQKAAMVKWKAY